MIVKIEGSFDAEYDLTSAVEELRKSVDDGEPLDGHTGRMVFWFLNDILGVVRARGAGHVYEVKR